MVDGLPKFKQEIMGLKLKDNNALQRFHQPDGQSRCGECREIDVSAPPEDMSEEGCLILLIYTNHRENPITWGKGKIFNRFLILYLADEEQ